MYEHIKQWKNDGEPKFKTKSKKEEKKDKKESSDLDLFISDKEWDLWTTNQEKWQKNIRNFSSKTQKEENNKKEKNDPNN